MSNMTPSDVLREVIKSALALTSNDDIPRFGLKTMVQYTTGKEVVSPGDADLVGMKRKVTASYIRNTMNRELAKINKSVKVSVKEGAFNVLFYPERVDEKGHGVDDRWFTIQIIDGVSEKKPRSISGDYKKGAKDALEKVIQLACGVDIMTASSEKIEATREVVERINAYLKSLNGGV